MFAVGKGEAMDKLELERIEEIVRRLERIPPADREAIIHRAYVAACRDASKLIKGGKKDESNPLKSEFKL